MMGVRSRYEASQIDPTIRVTSSAPANAVPVKSCITATTGSSERSVNVPPALVSSLRSLAHDDLDGSALLYRDLGRLASALRAAAPSVLGFSLVLVVDREPVRVDLVDPAGAPTRTTLALPLDWITGSMGSEMVVFAGIPGTLVDLAADLSYVLPTGVDVVLDRHLDARPATSGTSGADRVSTTNVAIGIMIEQGLMPQDALTTLTRRAVTLGVPFAEAAAEVVADAKARAAARGLTG